MAMPNDDELMLLAIAAARNAPRAPFGAVIADSRGEVISTGWNRGFESPTRHGEVVAIDAAAPARPDWPRCTLVTTAEPCPMCAAAALWAGVGRIVYGTSIPTLMNAGWWQIDVRAAEVIARAGGRVVELVGGVRESDCDDLFSSGPS